MTSINSKVLVLGDNIDTDQILTAEFMKIDASTDSGYQALGKLAFCGLPQGNHQIIDHQTGKSHFKILIAGENFGCGSSREHAPIALGAAGFKIVIARSFARIFYRNCMTTGEILPVEIDQDLSLETGCEVICDTQYQEIYSIASPQGVGFRVSQSFQELVTTGGLFPYARALNRL